MDGFVVEKKKKEKNESASREREASNHQKKRRSLIAMHIIAVLTLSDMYMHAGAHKNRTKSEVLSS